MDAVGALLAVVARDGRIAHWNRQCEQVTGYTLGEVSGQPFWEILIPEEERNAVQSRSERRGERHEMPAPAAESHLLTKSGERRLIAWSSSDLSGCQEHCFLATGFDVTDRDLAIHNSEQRLQCALAATRDAIWEYDNARDVILYISPRWMEIFGAELDRSVPRALWRRRIHPDDLALHIAAMSALERGETAKYECEFRMRHADGRWIWVLNRAVVSERNADGKARRIVGAITDISKRKLAEESRAIAYRELQSVFAASPLAMVQVDREGLVLRWSPAATRLFGWREHEVIGRELPVIPREDLEAFRNEVRGSLNPDSAARKEAQRLCKDGSLVDVGIWTAPLRSSSGEQTGLMLEYADLTERKSLEERIRLAQKLEAIGSLAGGIAHDFNNLLTTIVGYSGLLAQSKTIPENQRKQLAEVLAAGERATELTRQLLAFSSRARLESGSCDLNHAVTEIARGLSRSVGERIQIEVQLVPGAQLVKMDRRHMDEVILNLAVNARDAMPEGGILRLSTARLEATSAAAKKLDLTSGDHIVLSVIDTGSGMAPEIQRRIFEPFFTTKAPGPGTGLGLSTVYGLVRQAGGNISVWSAPGQGSRFSIFLPTESGKTAPGAGSQLAEPQADRTTVMVVEDDPGVRSYVAELLRNNGYPVIEMPAPLEALGYFEAGAGRIDLVLTDIVMPGMNGVELIGRLRKTDAKLKSIYMSGYPDRMEHLSGRIPGDAFLPKPFSAAALLEAVRQALICSE